MGQKYGLHEYVKRELADRKGSWRLIAEMSGVSYRAIYKIGTGEVADPRVRTLERLVAFFDRNTLRSLSRSR